MRETFPKYPLYGSSRGSTGKPVRSPEKAVAAFILSNRIRGKPILSTPKTPESVRTIPVSKWIIDLINERLPEDNGFIFHCKNGDIWSPRSFLKYYQRALMQTNIRYLSPHCCRHTYATRLYAAGADAKTIQTLMGHTDYALTANIYTHVKDEQLRKAVELLNKPA